MLMISGWYHSEKNGQRLLTSEEVATACCITNDEVKKWLEDNHLKRARPGEDLVDSAEVISFLIRHNMPVSPWLLPPQTKKILFIAADEGQFQDQSDTFDHICRFFAESCNILVETSLAGKYADLCIFTFCPNIVVMFIRECSEYTETTLNFLSSIPEQQTILIVDELLWKAKVDGLLTLPAHLIVSENLPVASLRSQLQSVFVNRSQKRRPLPIF
ncbi:hypothetical protein JCM39068_22650 [Desulfocastanea catecholica]